MSEIFFNSIIFFILLYQVQGWSIAFFLVFPLLTELFIGRFKISKSLPNFFGSHILLHLPLTFSFINCTGGRGGAFIKVLAALMKKIRKKLIILKYGNK